ncbi:MAG: hypothetical protein WBW88_17435 [Rhodothermales bacterium]
MPESIDGGLARMIANQAQTGLATGDPEADAFLRESSTAVLMGILFDQRIRAEVAFSGPYKLYRRLGHFDLARIASMDEETFHNVFTETPAVHRFANVMSARTQEFARWMTDEYGGDAENIWRDGADIDTIQRRLAKIKGFGPGKLKKFVPAMRLFGHPLPD